MSAPVSAATPAVAGKSSFPKLAAAAHWLAPLVVCLYLYRLGIAAWFQADDFAWLALRLHVSGWQSLLHALFAPMAQGTIRPWGDRGFFLALQGLFGNDALPFRICVFLTQCANLTLASDIARRLTGSRAAAVAAAIFWVVNSGLALSMVWTSAYDQVLCAFFLLSAFWFLLRYLAGGRRRDLIGQWIFFLLGFGALEINVVYPALAALYVYLFARPRLRTTLPLFIPSALFTILDRMVAASKATGDYALHFDLALPQTFRAYCSRSFVPSELVPWMKGGLDVALASVLGLTVVAFAAARARKGDWLPTFCVGWFVIVLAPVLPLRDHIEDYYLAPPTIGLAILGGYAAVLAWRSTIAWKALAILLASAYLAVMVHADRIVISWWYDRSKSIERMVLGVVRARQLHPSEGILLDGVESGQFWAGIYHNAFRPFGVFGVYLTPGSERTIEPNPELGPVDRFVLPPGPTLHGLDTNEIVIYRIGPRGLKAITSEYANTTALDLTPEIPSRVDAGSPLLSYLLGPEWYRSEDGFRWMPKRATLKIHGPRSASEKLHLTGYCPEGLLESGPVPLRVTVGEVTLPEIALRVPQFDVSLDLPPQTTGKDAIEITIQAGRAVPVGPSAVDFALRFGVFEIR